jgi:hypothetical protein
MNLRDDANAKSLTLVALNRHLFFGGSSCFFTCLSIFLIGDDDGMYTFVTRFDEQGLLFFGEDLCGILQFASSSDEMIGRHCDRHIKIAKAYSEFSFAQELFVLPALDIIVHTHAWIELGDGVEVVFIFCKIFITRSTTELHAVIDIVPPLELEAIGLACTQWLG